MKMIILAATVAALGAQANATCFTRVKDGVRYTFATQVVDGFPVSRTVVGQQLTGDHGAIFTRVKDGIKYTFATQFRDGFPVERTVVGQQLVDPQGQLYCQ